MVVKWTFKIKGYQWNSVIILYHLEFIFYLGTKISYFMSALLAWSYFTYECMQKGKGEQIKHSASDTFSYLVFTLVNHSDQDSSLCLTGTLAMEHFLKPDSSPHASIAYVKSSYLWHLLLTSFDCTVSLQSIPFSGLEKHFTLVSRIFSQALNTYLEISGLAVHSQ